MAHFSTESVAHLDDTKYQGSQSVMAISVGGMMGRGLGQGLVKLGWLPEDTTDFIFAIIAEELGWAGCFMVVALYLLIIWQGIRVMAMCNNQLGKLLVLSITSMISCQALINLMVVTGMAPTKGIALPFVSAGGSGLVVTAMAMRGINQYCQTKHPVNSRNGQIAFTPAELLGENNAQIPFWY